MLNPRRHCYERTLGGKASHVPFDLVDVPFTRNSFWYCHVGTVEAGVNLEGATYAVDDHVITINLAKEPVWRVVPDMEQSCVLEERNNVLNPITVADVDAHQRYCVQRGERIAVEHMLLDEAVANAERNLSDMFSAAMGEDYQVVLSWDAEVV